MVYTRIKNWVQRNRYPLAIGAGIVGATYFTAQYLLGKLNEARQGMSDDRIAKANLRRRFAQNQEDCTYTVLALLPTATENVATALPVEDITAELQARRTERSARSVASSAEFAPSDSPSTSGNGDGSAAGESSGFLHTSRLGESGGSESGNVKSKMALWNEVKIYSLTRAITLIYTLSLLTLLTRIQLNLLGRRNYLSSVISLASPPSPGSPNKIDLENRDDPLTQDYGSDFDTNRMYLTFSWWLLHRGLQELKESVEVAVRTVFRDLSARDTLTFERFTECILDIRKRVEGEDEQTRRNKRWLPFLLPGSDDEERVLRESGIGISNAPEGENYKISRSLRRLLDETSDIIDSPTFSHVLTLALDASFSLLVDEKVADQGFKIPHYARRHLPSPPKSSVDELLGGAPLGSRIEEVDDSEPSMLASDRAKQSTAKLATVLAIITRQAHVIGSGGDLGSLMASSNMEIPDMTASQGASLKDANEYLAAIDDVRDIEAFAAVVYSSNFEVDELERVEDDVKPEPTLSNSADIEQSLVDVGQEVEESLESAWGQAVERAQATTS